MGFCWLAAEIPACCGSAAATSPQHIGPASVFELVEYFLGPLIVTEDPFVAHSSRYLIEARKPRGR
jgi:hypothetical protein